MTSNTKPAKTKEDIILTIVKVISILMMMCGIGVLIGFNVISWQSQIQAEQTVDRYREIYSSIDDEEKIRYRDQAIAYNQRLSGEQPAFELMNYEAQLLYLHEPMMSYLDIPKLGIKLPVYHGTAEQELMNGIGHLEGSSLPIGGIPSNCVLLGHSGMKNARMLDDLKEIEIGDKIVLWTLDDPYAYEVTDKVTVLPEVAETMVGLADGKDQVMLITCTPYGINTHRLVVTAERCEYDENAPEYAETAIRIDEHRELPLIIAAVLVISFLTPLIITKRRKKD